MLKAGDRVKFRSEKRPYRVQASNERFAICTKPFNLKHTTLYTIVDLQEQVRGPEDLIFGRRVETREDCEGMLARLMCSCPQNKKALCGCGKSQVSYRNRVPLDIELVN